MKSISSSLEDIKDNYDVVVIGSGYGGGIAASRMARAGRSVCLLERGKEFLPGEFPNTLLEANSEMQLDTPKTKIGSDTGLFNFHVGKGINVLSGCGLGGTSLINANVSLKVDPRVFENGKWPQALIDDKAGMERGYQLAEEMLKPSPYPENFPHLDKLAAHQKSGEYLGKTFYRTPINVNFKDQVNHVGVEQKACNNCGDCVSGCNNTAKNTTQMNYLPDAHNHGAEIFTECSVSYIKKSEDGWQVYFEPVGMGRKKFDAPLLFVQAKHVIVSAGTLGSTEIMLRSRANGLKMSDKLGYRFSGNGDVLGFGYNTDGPINGIGFGNKNPENMDDVGPCITSVIDTRESSENYRNGLIIEEGSIPGALSAALPAAFAGITSLIGKDTDEGLVDKVKELGRATLSLVRGAYHGAVKNTQTYLIMSHDNDDGQIELNEKNRVELNWPGVGREPIFEKANDTLEKCTEALGGTYMENPIWTKAFDKDLISVHPLGGCIMGDNVESGVINHKGQVFDPEGEIHDGLYITDGSIIPASLGVNPLFTISAISERNMAILAKENNWSIDYSLPSKPRPTPEKGTVGIRFTETMKGFWSKDQLSDYQKGYDSGKTESNPFEFTLTIQTDNVDQMVEDPKHQAEIVGSVIAPGLSPEPLMVAGGTFNLFVDYDAAFNTKRMNYALPMRSETGDRFFMEGYKQIDETDGPKLWPETSTLYITLFEGENNQGKEIGKGILHIEPMDFLKQMTTMKPVNASSVKEKLEATYKFGKFFAGSLWEVYGGILKKSEYFDPNAPARKKRPLRVGAPEVYPFTTADRVNLRLTRYQGGKKGPVICSHGLGVASSIFSTDLIDTNLLEYLYAHEYDVWLLDYRASIELPASKNQSSGDEIAKYDYPAAVETVQSITGAKDVQFVVHCFGSTTWSMSMLAGLQGVRSAVCSQVSTHIVAPTLTKIKSGLHIPGFLDKAGVDSLTAYVDSESNWINKLYDKILKVYPLPYEEWCNSPVCHRISFLYSLLYEHDKLNQELHDNLHELFGIANITALEHLAELVRKKHVVTMEGEDIYMPHPERMAIPIRFISGEKNDCFLPESTKETYDWLCEANGSELYSRKVIPGYGHIDCIFGDNAVEDVFPVILEHLEETN
ncbi:MAG: GMC family oxidoreductase N-terminal domain-containing protein [Reichenbachiella sp.]|uniref:GMC family oxidoreductase N-terminal domain-containing protein n=3 Tax=Reichenbachiella sp. TaxID=2184521 RepID=UPI003266B03A